MIETPKGYATIEWTDKKGVDWYLIHYSDGRTCYTNSLNIVNEQLQTEEVEQKQTGQLSLF